MMGWQWHQLDHMQIICTSLQTDNHPSTAPLSFLQAGRPSCRPTNSIKALQAETEQYLRGGKSTIRIALRDDPLGDRHGTVDVFIDRVDKQCIRRHLNVDRT